MKWLKKRRLNKQINQAVRLLAKIDRTMTALGIPRYKRRQIKKDFLRKDSETIRELLNGAKS